MAWPAQKFRRWEPNTGVDVLLLKGGNVPLPSEVLGNPAAYSTAAGFWPFSQLKPFSINSGEPLGQDPERWRPAVVPRVINCGASLNSTPLNSSAMVLS